MINHKAFFCFTAFNLKFNVSHILQKQDDLLTLKDNTKILSETDTETFFCLNKVVWNQNQGFFPETKFSKTETDTFFRDQIFRNQIWLFPQDQILRNQKQNPTKIG